MNNRFHKLWRKLRDQRGMTMAEMLIVVAIIAVLSGVSFIAVTRYQRSLGQLERDQVARQIFVAAQNHLTAAKGTVRTDKGTAETPGGTDGVYYFAYNAGGSFTANSVLGDMLPFGSIDETIRTGGNYVIRYQEDTGTVLDVFYCTNAGSPVKFNHRFFEGDDYTSVKGMAGDDKKAARKNYVNESIIGWYGGADATMLQYVELDPPEIEVVNAERLYVKITDPNQGNTEIEQGRVFLRMLVTGESSGTKHYIDVTRTAAGKYEVVLDDITDKDLHFCNRKFDDMQTTDTSNGFIPGENITIQAFVDGTVDASSKTVFVPAYSAGVTTNSLFASAAETNHVLDTAYISNIRHLENLDASVSNRGNTAKVAFTAAVQDVNLTEKQIVMGENRDLSWNGFKNKINAASPDSVAIVRADGKATEAGQYLPVNLGTITSYDGGSHSIKGVTANGKLNGETISDVGLFSALDGQTVSHLELLDFSVSGTNAGALAGSANTVSVTNVLARSSGTATATNISASGSAGGLIGSMTGGSVTDSAAALIVSGNTAGGLIGTASNSATVTGCYSGGHTDKGEYWNHDAEGKRTTAIYNVTATGATGTAGGLIGSFTGTKIENSYSTCSATGATAGGFVGTASGASVDNCYCTGLVKGTAAEGAFAASEIGNASGCQYFSIINERSDAAGSFTYLKACGAADNDAVTPFDETAASYNSFVPSSDLAPARPYDAALLKYYSGKYSLPSIKDLSNAAQTGYVSAHYGDWPAPEIFTINN